MKIQEKITNNDGLVAKAGGIVYKKEGDEIYILMLYREEHGDWTFPKGHIEKGETREQTAKREIKEECGIETEIIKKLPSNTYLNPKTNEETICYMFLLRPKTQDIILENSGDKAEWVQLDKVRDKLSHDNLKTYFDGIIHEIR